MKESKSERERKHTRVQRGSGRTGGGAPRGGEKERSTGEAVKAGRWALAAGTLGQTGLGIGYLKLDWAIAQSSLYTYAD
uniref:Uncharacterized protein n=1 Tax=Fagus sylvatica TaxID=28930 RepID=A0A2N9HZQ5_FAGSY